MCANGQFRPIKMTVGHSCLTGKYFARCSRPGMDSTSFLSGISLIACGTSLYICVRGRVNCLVPSSEDTVIPFTSVQCWEFEVPSIVWVERVVGRRCFSLMPNFDAIGG